MRGRRFACHALICLLVIIAECAMMHAAAQVVRQYYAKPVGTNVDIQVEGKHFVARIERHYHPEGGPIKPWGFHPGVSLFALR